MTCGIYILKFNGTDSVYIGQSTDIEDRFIKHLSAFRRRAAPPKLQQAYDTLGIPEMEILIECKISELNDAEREAIDIYDSVNSGFNTLAEAGSPVLHGDMVGTSKYSNAQYVEVLKLLVQDSPTLSKRQIQELTGVSLYTIRHIAALESHAWLKEEEPLLYAKLERIKHTKPMYRGVARPKIVSPEGITYEVEHITNFAKEHGLLQPKLSEVLKGTRNHHKGWRLVKDSNPKVEA